MTKEELEEIKNSMLRIEYNGTTHMAINYQYWNKIIAELEKNLKE